MFQSGPGIKAEQRECMMAKAYVFSNFQAFVDAVW